MPPLLGRGRGGATGNGCSGRRCGRCACQKPGLAPARPPCPRKWTGSRLVQPGNLALGAHWRQGTNSWLPDFAGKRRAWVSRPLLQCNFWPPRVHDPLLAPFFERTNLHFRYISSPFFAFQRGPWEFVILWRGTRSSRFSRLDPSIHQEARHRPPTETSRTQQAGQRPLADRSRTKLFTAKPLRLVDVHPLVSHFINAKLIPKTQQIHLPYPTKDPIFVLKRIRRC